MAQANQPDGTGFTGGLYMKLANGTYVVVADADGNIDAPVTTDNLTTTGNTTLGNNAGLDILTVDSISTFNGTVTVGVDGTGKDVKFFGDTASKSWLWDESADTMIVTAASQFTGLVTVGVDGTGHDVKLFGDTAGRSWLWDESADKMIVSGTADIDGTLTMLGGRGIASSVATALVPFVLAAAMSNTTDTAAVSVANYYTTLTTTGAAVPTLADGSVVGQMKKIEFLVDAGDAVLTPANLAGGTTITFADIGDVAELIWNGNDWVAIALYNTVDGATAPVLA